MPDVRSDADCRRLIVALEKPLYRSCFALIYAYPAELHYVFRRNQKLMYGLLMQVSAAALKELCANRRHLGALPGILSVLHTFNGQLGYHPHVHMLITGGGITADGERWEPARGEFLVPVNLLSKKIAARFRDALRKIDPDLFLSIAPSVWRREWVSFVKHYGMGSGIHPKDTFPIGHGCC